MKKNLNIKKIICIIILLIILIPILIRFYNESTPTKVSKETQALYESAFQLYNEGNRKLKNVCITTDDNNNLRKYKLNEKYTNNKNYDLIDNFLCKDITELMDPINMLFYRKYESFDLSIMMNIPINAFYKPYFETLKDTEYEIIYNYAESIRKLKEKNDFYDIYENNNIYKTNAKKHLQNNYEKQINYEIEQLKAINHIIEYFEYNLDNT